MFQQSDRWLWVTLIAIVQLAAPAWTVEPAEPTSEIGVGDAITTHIVVQFDRSFLDMHTIAAGQAIDAGAIDALNRTWGVTGTETLLSRPAANTSAAAARGLDRYFVFSVPEGTDTSAMAEAYRAAPGVTLAEVDGVGGISETIPNDADFGRQWNMRNTGQTGGIAGADIAATFAWDMHVGSGNVTIAVIDTGVQADHPELIDRVIPGWNFFNNNDNSDDVHGHGTHVSGIAGASGNNSIGMAGVNWNVRILAVRVTSASGTYSESDLAEAIVWATDNDAQFISMSLQSYTGIAALEDAIDYARDNGVLPIAATGNNRGSVIAFPARFAGCMAVGATDHNDQWPSFSNWGPQIDVVAPGDDIYSLHRGSNYRTRSGTSMATPHVSGLASLLLSFNSCLSPIEMIEMLHVTSVDLGPPGFDQKFGHGRIDAFAAINEAAALAAGDANCDCELNAFDIEPFLLALFDPQGHAIAYPDCDITRADVNGDGNINAFDIEPFLQRLFP